MVEELLQATTPEGPQGVVTDFDLGELQPSDLLFAGGTTGTVQARVIRVNQVNSFTTLEETQVELQNGVPVDGDLTLACVIPRAALTVGTEMFEAGYKPIVCLVGGFGLKQGGYATSFAHDSHNFFLLGRDPQALYQALTSVIDAGGGMAFAPGESAGQDGVPAEQTVLPLPLAGLLSDQPVSEVGPIFAQLEKDLRAAGVAVKAPILLLTLLSLSVSPDFKVTDKGIVDVQARRILSPVVR